MTLPSVYSYLDYRAFLKDWLEARKRLDDAYSYAAFARDGGCSKAALANVLGRSRTPRPNTLDAFAQAMELEPVERNYLGLLVELSTARDLEARRDVMDRILASERYRQLRRAESDDDADVLRYLESWYVPVVWELAGADSFQADPDWVASVCSPRITRDQADDALRTLFELGFLRHDAAGHIERTSLRFETDAEAFQCAAAHYHGEALPELMRAIPEMCPQERQLQAATLMVPTDLVPALRERVHAFVRELATQADDPSQGGDRRVYQLAVQLLPVSEVVV